MFLQALAAHLCYAIAGCAPSYMDGTDATPTPSTAASASASPRSAALPSVFAAIASVTGVASAPASATIAAVAEAVALPSGPRFCLLGSDIRTCPRTYVNFLALHRTELLEQCLRQAANNDPAFLVLPLQVSTDRLPAVCGDSIVRC